jgi:uncharacterized RDD family membrane protein YckC
VKNPKPNQIVLANWGRRFIAWFVDYAIINVLLAYFGIEQVEASFVPSILLPRLPGSDISIWSPMSVLVFFLYWTFSEWYFGRSIGQLLLNLRLVDSKGKSASLRASAIQSFGKSLLLPFDCLAGWVYEPFRQKRQRFFNGLSNTIVIFIGKPAGALKKGRFEREP